MFSSMKVGCSRSVGRELSREPPWSMAMSTMTEPGFIERRVLREMSLGALAPGMRIEEMVRSASEMRESMLCGLEIRVETFLGIQWESVRRWSRLISRRKTWAPRFAAVIAACEPAEPAPMTRTLPGGVPGTPPRRMPRPPFSFSR